MVYPTYYPTQKIMFNNVEDDTFFIAKTNDKHTYEYASFKDIDTFIKHYENQLIKNYYELIPSIEYRYEYYDLDLKLTDDTDITTFTNTYLFNWFVNTRKNFLNNFLNITHNSYLLKEPYWIVTTASTESKLSLHILNKNAIFPNNETLKTFVNYFKDFLNANPHPFNSCLDTAVYSSNRLMRIVESSKDGQNRPLSIWKEFHSDKKITIKDTLIISARDDKRLETSISHNTLVIGIHHFTLKKQSDNLSSSKNIKYDSQKEYHRLDDEMILEYLSCLSQERKDNYQDWITVGMALKSEGYDFHIWANWSKDSEKYDENACIKCWENFRTKEENNINYNIGTIRKMACEDNPELYRTLSTKEYDSNIKFTFTHDIEINEKYISENTYEKYLNTHDIIALKSCMNTGKTFSIPSLFNNFEKILVVYSRISLNQEIYNKWKQYGFQIYSNIEDYYINSYKHKRVIIQIDSIHRFQGNLDFLILDEIESTAEHLCGSKLMTKTAECYDTLMCYIKNTKKIILCDANLKDDTLNSLLIRRKENIIKINNNYKSFSKLSSTIYTDKNKLIKKIFDLIDNNKKIAIPTNSKKWSKTISKLLSAKYDNIKILNIDAENKMTTTKDWINYDIVIYTPTITSGISFDLIHFHTVCAYFTKKSTSAESSSQMLFRVRNLIDNNMHICLPVDASEVVKPIVNSDIVHYVNEKIRVGNSHLKLDGIKIDKYNQRAKDTKYFKLFCSYLEKEHKSFLFFHSYMLSILKTHGIKINYDETELVEKNKKEIKEKVSYVNLEIKEEDIDYTVGAIRITAEENLKLREQKKEKTKEQIYSMKLYNLMYSFDKNINDTITRDFVEKNLKYIYSYRRFKEVKDEKIDDSIEYVLLKNNENQNKVIVEKEYREHQSDDECISDVEEDDFDDSKRLYSYKMERKKKLKFIKNIDQSIYNAIHYDKTYLKMYHCLNFLKYAGFEMINDGNKIKPNFQNMLKYVRDNEKDIRILFDSKEIKFPEELEKNTKQSLIKYINSKLENVFGIKIEKTSGHKDAYYKIKELFQL